MKLVIEDWMIIKDVSELKIGDRVGWYDCDRIGDTGTISKVEKEAVTIIWSDGDAGISWYNSDLLCVLSGEVGVCYLNKKVKDTKIARVYYKNKIKSEIDGYLIVESI